MGIVHRQKGELMSDFDKLINASDLIEWIMETYPDWCVGVVRSIVDHIEDLPSAQQEDWMERNKERILQAGMEGREIEFRIGGRLFAIREKAQ